VKYEVPRSPCGLCILLVKQLGYNTIIILIVFIIIIRIMKRVLPNFFHVLLEASYSYMLFLHGSNISFFNVNAVFYVLPE